jgi:hypothetical protein
VTIENFKGRFQRIDKVGRLQRQARRAFIASGGRPLRTGEVARRCYPRAVKIGNWQREAVRSALHKFAVPIGRSSRGRGRPTIWAPKPELERAIKGKQPFHRRLF